MIFLFRILRKHSAYSFIIEDFSPLSMVGFMLFRAYFNYARNDIDTVGEIWYFIQVASQRAKPHIKTQMRRKQGNMKVQNRRCLVVLFLILLLPLVLPACAPADGENPGVTTLIYANLTEDGVDRGAVDRFNRTHTDVQIEVQDYFEENGQSGRDRLMVEMAAGKIPDIIDLGGRQRLPYYTLARKGFLEDLWPYIENDPDLGREGVLEAPLKAAEADGALCAVFSSVLINTLVGARSIVGDRTSWTLAELQEAFSAMSEDSTILEYTYSRDLIFEYLFSASLDSYVDWDTGECGFASEQFKSALRFINSIPAADVSSERSDEETMAELVERIFSGRQMLTLAHITRPRDLQMIDAYYGLGEPAVFIGFPTEDGSAGSSFRVRGDRVLAMSSVCQNKDAAWDFLRELLLPQFKSIDQIMEAGYTDLPVNRADYEMLIECDSSRDEQGSTGLYMGPEVKLRKSTPEELERFETLLNSIDKINLYDTALYSIVYEAVGPYFAGDKTLDETVDMLNNRVGLYLNEQR